MRYPLTVRGTDLVYEHHWNRRKPLLFSVGHEQGTEEELPRDRWGNYQLPTGQSVLLGYDWLQWAPVLEVGQERILAARPVDKRVVVGLAALNGLALFGGCGAGILAVATSVLILGLLRRPDRRRAHIIVAVALPIIAVVLYVAVALAMHRLR